MINKNTIKLIEQYSFLTNVALRGGFLLMSYKKDGEVKVAKLPVRANRDQLIRKIDRIKKEVNYAEWRAKEDERIKAEAKIYDPPSFAYTTNDETTSKE